MPVGTVRGRYELDAPALRTLRDLERQGVRTQKQMREVGKAIDSIGDREDQQRIERVQKTLRSLSAETARATREMEGNWRRSTRSISQDITEQIALIEVLHDRIRALGRERAVAQIDVSGIAASMAEVGALNRRLTAFGRRNVTARVGTRSVGGGPRAPRTGSMAPVTSGGGGGGGGIVRTLDAGPLSLSPRAWPVLLGGGLTGGRALLGGAGALAGSAGMGLLGAGALGIAGGGALAAGVGGGLLGGRAAVGQIGEARKAMEKFNDVIADYGRNSREAARAKRDLDQAMAAAPAGTRQLLRDTSALSAQWGSLTRPAAGSFVSLMGTGVRRGRMFAPTAARGVNRVSRAIDREGSRLARFGTGGFGRRFVGQGSAMFDENLGNVRGTVEGAAGAGLNVMQASRPFLREATRFIRDWARGWERSTSNITSTRARIREMINHLRSWVRLTRSAGGLAGALLGAGAGDGQRMVDRLTDQLNRWEQWVRMNPRKVREFFRETVDSTIDLARAVGRIVAALESVGDTLTPLLDRFSQLIALSGQLGLLTPGAGALAYGAFRGLRGGRGGGGRGGGSGGGSGAAIVPVGGGGLRGAARGAGRMPGYISGTYGLARSFGYGRAASAGAAARGALSTPGALGMGALRGAGKAFWPVAAGLGVLDFASFDGNLAGRAQNALSGATLGIVPRPLTDAEIADRGIGRAQKYLGGLSMDTGLRSQRGAIGDLRGRIAENARRAGAMRTVTTGRGGVGREVHALSDRERRELASENKELRAALAERVRILRDYQRDRNRQLDALSRGRAAQFSQEFQTGFRRRSRRVGAGAAMDETTSGVVAQMRNMRGAGARVLAQNTLAWARQAKNKNPELEDEYKRLTRRIVGRFRQMGKDIRIVDGQILDGSRKEWRNIADAIHSQARRGVDKTAEEYKRLNRIAIGALMEQGFSRSEARKLVSGQRAGGDRRSDANRTIRYGSNYGTSRINSGGGPQGTGRTGDGLGRMRGDGIGLMGANSGLAGYAQLASRYGSTVTSGRRPGATTLSGNQSYHASGNALDLSPNKALARYLFTHFGGRLEELITPWPEFNLKDGRPFTYSAAIQAQHRDHIHIADTAGAPGGAGRGGGGQGGAINLRARTSGLRGVPGGLADAAMANIAKGMERGINRRIGAAGGQRLPGRGAPSVNGAYTKSQLTQLARSVGMPNPGLMAAIAMAESTGNPRALGIPTSGGRARGLWQIMWPLHRARFPGMDPYNPRDNAMMAKSILADQGLGAWEAYTKGMHRRFMGDGIGRQTGATPRAIRSQPRAMNVRMGGVSVSFAGAVFNVRSQGDVEAIAEAVGRKILHVLRRDDPAESTISG